MTGRLDLREWTAEGDRKPFRLVVVDGFRTRYSAVCVLAQIKWVIYITNSGGTAIFRPVNVFVHGHF